MGKRKRYTKKTELSGAEEKGSLNTIVLAVVVVLVVIVGVYAFTSRDSGDSSSTDSRDFPDFVYTSSKSVEAYTVATQIPEVLEKMPCYCGCVSVGHDSLKGCFLSPGGGYSDHGAYCNVCVAEALDVKKWHSQGLDIKEIRSKIDGKYGGGRFAEGTDTPPV